MKRLLLIVSLLVLLPLVSPRRAWAGTSYQINLRADRGDFVVAEGAGGGGVYANRSNPSFWETFILTDLDGSTLQSGHRVNIQSWDRHFLTAEGGGGPGSVVHANRSAASTWERITIWKANGSGTIRSGDPVAFQSLNQYWVSADYGYSDHRLMADRANRSSWETFRISVAPPGFYLLSAGTGVQVYRKDYSGGSPDFVTVANLDRSTIANLSGAVSGGSVWTEPQDWFWQAATLWNAGPRQAMVVVNGTFFNPGPYPNSSYPTGIAFGLKEAGSLVSTGYAYGKEYPGLVRMLAFDTRGARADVLNYGPAIFGAYPDVVGALDVTAAKSPSSYVPRTFAGVRDDYGDGRRETFLLYSTAMARQVDASAVLDGFGALGKVMLDGGGSTFMLLNGVPMVSTPRNVPHAIAIYSGRL